MVRVRIPKLTQEKVDELAASSRIVLIKCIMKIKKLTGAANSTTTIGLRVRPKSTQKS